MKHQKNLGCTLSILITFALLFGVFYHVTTYSLISVEPNIARCFLDGTEVRLNQGGGISFTGLLSRDLRVEFEGGQVIHLKIIPTQSASDSPSLVISSTLIRDYGQGFELISAVKPVRIWRDTGEKTEKSP